jgi:hypothetical protein
MPWPTLLERCLTSLFIYSSWQILYFCRINVKGKVSVESLFLEKCGVS